MALLSGARLGPYAIQAPLGAGGMGEVYRARDTRLDRDVAIKVLPDAFVADADRAARFEREAKTLAALNHPHIAQIYGVEEQAGTRALVMELVEGETLAERLTRGPIALADALPVAKQIAEALDAAHDAGIVHRDLKPANIKLRPDGTIKLLDFGLAKAFETDASDLAQSPTVTALSRAGVLLGTAAYMSPEQARGKRVDKRADIWAFGCVLYEMLAGVSPFAGETTTDTLSAIVTGEPDWHRLPAGTTAAVRGVLKRCLEKDPRRRLRDIGDVALEAPDSDLRTEAAPASRWWLIPGLAAGAALLALGAVGSGTWPGWTRSRDVPPVTRFAVPFAPTQRLEARGRPSVAVTPDGRRIVYATNEGLRAHALDQLAPGLIQGTETLQPTAALRGSAGIAVHPFVSPDGEAVAYWQNGELKRVALTGGTPVTLCRCAIPFGATWNSNNHILFGGRAAPASPSGVWRVSAFGGEPELLIRAEPGQTVLRPQLLPEGNTILFSVTTGEHWDRGDIVTHSLSTGQRTVIIRGGLDARYLPSGHLVFGRAGVIHAVPFDASTLRLTGTAVPVLADVAQQTSAGAWGGFDFDVSATGAAVYVPETLDVLRRVLIWVDHNGREEPLATEPRAYQYPRLSPDRQRVALDLRDQQNDVWVWDLERTALTRVTVGRRAGGPAIWSHDGNFIIFSPDVEGQANLHRQPINGGSAQRLTSSGNYQFPDVITPDGKQLVFEEVSPDTRFDLRALPLDVSGAQPVDLLRTPFNEQNAHLSPDGKWLAYQSDESGRFEVYVRPFPDVNRGRWTVSSGGATRPLWSRDGRELYFLDLERRMTVIPVQMTPQATFGRPRTLFDTRHLGLEGQQRNFELSADGRKFLMVRNLPPPAGVPAIIVIQNWFTELSEKTGR